MKINYSPLAKPSWWKNKDFTNSAHAPAPATFAQIYFLSLARLILIVACPPDRCPCTPLPMRAHSAATLAGPPVPARPPTGSRRRLKVGASVPACLHGHHCRHQRTSHPQPVLPGKRRHRARIRYPPPWWFTVRSKIDVEHCSELSCFEAGRALYNCLIDNHD
jgi:hypothetical protein